MNEVKVNKTKYPILGTGETVLICMEELHSDFFRLCNTFQSALAKGEVPLMDVTGKIMYCFIKSANEDSFKSYKEFMKSIHKLSDFLDAKNAEAILAEITAIFLDDEELDKTKNEKKKETADL
nr:hypothetical protein [uncultured Lachnoclostridium sp.]